MSSARTEKWPVTGIDLEETKRKKKELEVDTERLRAEIETLKSLRKKQESDISQLRLEESDFEALDEIQNDPSLEGYRSTFSSQYLVSRIIGCGRHGMVFEAKNVFDQSVYAVKRLSVNRRDSEAALTEARAVALLDHPNIVRYHNTWIEEPPYGWQKIMDAKLAILTEFTVKRILGEGGFGCVFEAVNKNDDWSYAVKRIGTGPRGVKRALDEARAMAQLEHPGIVGYKDTWVEEPPEGWQYDADMRMLERIGARPEFMHYADNSAFLYIQMELCNSSLSEWLEENRKISRDLPQMKTWFKQIVEAVAYIHSKNFIHRDLKPANILLANNDRLKICDMGIAAAETKSIADIDSSRNNYRAPEQMNVFEYSSKVDVFALGLILIELCINMDLDTAQQVFDNYRKGIPNSILDSVPDVKDIVSWMTNVESKKRPDCSEIQLHTFLKNPVPENSLQVVMHDSAADSSREEYSHEHVQTTAERNELKSIALQRKMLELNMRKKLAMNRTEASEQKPAQFEFFESLNTISRMVFEEQEAQQLANLHTEIKNSISGIRDAYDNLLLEVADLDTSSIAMSPAGQEELKNMRNLCMELRNQIMRLIHRFNDVHYIDVRDQTRESLFNSQKKCDVLSKKLFEIRMRNTTEELELVGKYIIEMETIFTGIRWNPSYHSLALADTRAIIDSESLHIASTSKEIFE